MKITILGAVAALLLSAPSFAEQVKAPWKWTLDERLNARFDGQKRAARVTKHLEGQKGKRATAGTSAASLGDVIDGKVNPELFLPTELFRQLVFGGFVTHPQHYQLGVRDTSDDLFLAEEEWQQLRELTADYAANLRRERDLINEQPGAGEARQKAISAELTALRTEQCGLSAAALRRARKQYGAERFDRFLYTVVARPMTRFAGSVAVDRAAVATLRRNEENCQ